MNNFSEWYSSNYHRLSDYGIWLRGNEINTLAHGEYASRPFRVLFARLSTYKDTVHSFTHSLLYQLAVDIPGVFADLAYLVPKRDAEIFKQDKIPWLIGTQTKYGPQGFNLIGFSNSIIQEIINIPQVLEKSGIPLKKTERLKRTDLPIIILGGSSAVYTSSLWTSDPIVDGIFIGENPALIKDLLKICAKGYSLEKQKCEILEDMSHVAGFFLPEKQNIACKRGLTRSKDIELLERGIVSYNEETIGTGYLEISEGCQSICSFCAESWIKKPYIELDPDLLLEKAVKMKAEMALERINIYSFNFNMYSKFYKLIWNLAPLFDNIGLKTQRFDMLAKDPELIEYEKLLDKTNFSAGLEGISPRLRRYLNKNLDENLFLKSLSLVFKAACRELKIFLLCTGKELEEDFISFQTLLNKIWNEKEKSSKGTRVIFSITPLVRFPFTPLEYDKAPGKEICDEVIEKIRKIAERSGFEARTSMDTNEYLLSQILARASEAKIFDSSLAALREMDFVYYRGIPARFINLFIKNLEKCGISIENLFAPLTFEQGERKPWAFIDTLIKRSALYKIYQKNISYAEIAQGPLKEISRDKPFAASDLKARLKEIKEKTIEKAFYVNVNENMKGIPRKYFGTALARALMKIEPKLVPYFRHYVSSCWSNSSSRPVFVTGDDIIFLAWDKDALPILEADLKNPTFLNSVNSILEPWGELKSCPLVEKPSFRLRLEGPFELNYSDYFKKRGIKYTLYKEGHHAKRGTASWRAVPGKYLLKFTKESLKKRVVSEFRVEQMPGTKFIIELIPGEKFDVESFLKQAFIYKGKDEWVRISAVSCQ